MVYQFSIAALYQFTLAADNPLQGIDRLTPVEYPTQLIPEGVFDKVVGQERSSQQAPPPNTRLVDGVSPRGRSKSGQRCNCAGVSTHHRGCQVSQGIPMFFNQGGVSTLNRNVRFCAK